MKRRRSKWRKHQRTEYRQKNLLAFGLKPSYESNYNAEGEGDYARVSTSPPSQGTSDWRRRGLVVLYPKVETPNPGQQVGSYPQNFQTEQSPYVGSPWNSGLFDCHLDQTNAVMTAFFPCVTFGQIAEVVDATEPSQGSLLTCPFGSLIYLLSMIVCANCLIGSTYRKKLRNRYGLVEAPYEDVISHLFCPCCSLCQEFRELKQRDLDPSLGWKGILARQQAMQHGNQQINTPPRAQAMSK